MVYTRQRVIWLASFRSCPSAAYEEDHPGPVLRRRENKYVDTLALMELC